MAPNARTPRSPVGIEAIQPYRMHISQRYLDLTRQKLELVRLPRDPQSSYRTSDYGVTKADLEPLIDHWQENYDWRKQELFYNDALPQFRTSINGVRLHFVHQRSTHPAAMPLLYVHDYPESFIGVAKIIDALCSPVSTPPRGDENVQSFHVVAPSIPGFGFSDTVPEEANNMQMTAHIIDALMKELGYSQYMVHGSGWAFKVCRVLALTHTDSCIAIHTVDPEVPPPRSSFGYTNEDMELSGLSIEAPGLTPPPTPPVSTTATNRPQTDAYALCDSIPGLLAYMLDAIRPPRLGQGRRSPTGGSLGLQSAGHSPVSSRSPHSPYSAASPSVSRSPAQRQSPPGQLSLNDMNNVWSSTTLIDWTMMYWLPGPEVAMRWLVNSAALMPSLWLGYSNVPLGITHYRDTATNGYGVSSAPGQTPPQWAEAYHRVAMVRRREGRIRYAAWEVPSDVVLDLRELAGLVGGY